MTGTKRKKRLKKYMPLYIMMLPGIIYLIINNYIPMGGLILAFKKFNYGLGILGSPFNGLDNFKFLFTGSDTLIALRNTILYNLAFIVLGTILSVAVAVCLSQVGGKRQKKVYQTIILIPYLISIVIVSYMVYGFLSSDRGMFNSLAEQFGGERISWYTEPVYWPFILVIIYLWKNFGYISIIYYTSILGIDPSLYEAASMDGASRWKQIRYITLPALKPVITTMVLLQIGKIFYTDFGLFYQVPMDSGPLLSVTNTIDTYVYRALLVLNDVGRSSAVGFLQSVCGFIVVFVANKIVSKTSPENALF